MNYEKTVQEISLHIYELSKDLDFADYTENKQQEVNEIKQALFYIKGLAENKENANFFRTFYNALQNI